MNSHQHSTNSRKHLIISLNNQGALLVKTKDFRKAKCHFLRALALCNAEIEAANDEKKKDMISLEFNNNNVAYEETFLNESLTLSWQETSLERKDNCCCPTRHDEYLDSDTYACPGQSCHKNVIYQRTISMQTNTPEHMIPSYSFLFNILIFNLALAVHINAAEHPSRSDNRSKKSLLRAIKLYETAYVFIMKHDTPNVLFALAIVNNLGHAYQAIGESHIAEAYSERLLTLLMLCLNIGWDTTSFGFDCFVGNACHFIAGKEVIAAAAA